MTNKESSRQSLLNLFAPPEANWKGVFGLVCGLSAEEVFMDEMLEQFTGLSKKMRQKTGQVVMVLFQDGHNRPIESLPGLYNPWQNNDEKWKNLELMHAKVALLGFGESVAGKPVFYRLIVSTGNWTKEAVNNSLNLVWYCDYDTTGNEKDQRQSAKDMAEAVVFWKKLMGYYQVSKEVNKKIDGFLKNDKKEGTVLEGIKPPQRKYKPQFISNLLEDNASKTAKIFCKNSMGAQVINKFCASGTRRNFIICGSGFFESINNNDTPQEPEVLSKFIDYLQEKQILTADPEKWLVINPATCGAVGQWLKKTGQDNCGWKLCLAKHPDFDNSPYPFHAKYIFMGNYNSSDSITSGLLYLGSGNLSIQGFALGPGTGGNIEAGVVVEAQKYSEDELYEMLGIDYEDDLTIDDIPDETEGEDSEQPNTEMQTPPPIAACVWRREDKKLTWKWCDNDWNEVQLCGQDIKQDKEELVFKNKDINFSGGVKINAKKNGKSLEWTIPVFTEDGNFYCPPVQPKSGWEIIDDLSSFPAISYEDDDTDEGIESEDGGRGSQASSKDNFSDLRNELDSFPLHLATTLVETIAARNQQITEGQLPDWIALLRRTLIEGMSDEKKTELRGLGVNFLEPLIAEGGFAPSVENKEYEKVIREIIENWGLNYKNMGKQK